MPELGDFLGDLAVVPIAPDLVTSNQTQSLSSNKQAPTMEPSLRLSFFTGHIVPVHLILTWSIEAKLSIRCA